MSEQVNEISAQGKAEAEAELKELIEVDRPRIIQAIKVAREEGDLSENAEYHAAREEQGMLESRITTLENLLANAEVTAAPKGDTIGVGSSVSFKDVATGKVTDITLVHRLEASVPDGKLSAESPVGQALMGAKAGDTVRLETPGGSKELEINSVG